MSNLPAFVTHYYRGDRQPFLSLSSLGDEAVAAILPDLSVGSRRRFGPRYLALRRATEDKAYASFAALGGRPVLRHPHYFVLGSSAWFAGLYNDVREVTVPLEQLPRAATSFTWTDSITALGLGSELGVPPAPEGCEGLHTLNELESDKFCDLLPASEADYADYQHRLTSYYVEVQLWDDSLVKGLLAH